MNAISVPVSWIVGTLLLSLRFGIVIAFAPPFSLLAVPVLIRVAFGIAAGASLAALPGISERLAGLATGDLLTGIVTEAAIGMAVVFALQAVFAALYFAGRVLDIQAGFGLALLIDPNTSNQVPLLGTFFVYAAGIVFFAIDGHHWLMRLITASIEAVPPGSAIGNVEPYGAIHFFAKVFVIGLACAAAPIVALFLIDISIAFLSRTLPQMNVLLLGLQVKTLTLLIVLAASFAFIGPILVDLFESAQQFLPTAIIFGKSGTQ